MMVDQKTSQIQAVQGNIDFLNDSMEMIPDLLTLFAKLEQKQTETLLSQIRVRILKETELADAKAKLAKLNGQTEIDGKPIDAWLIETKSRLNELKQKIPKPVHGVKR